MSLNPPAMRGSVRFYGTIMAGKSPLSRVQREMLATVVSSENHCHYRIQAHAHDLLPEVGQVMHHAFQADAFVHAVARDWRSALLAPPDRALCEFAAKLTLNPQKISPANLDVLRSHSFDDRAIHDTVQAIGYVNYINRVADALGVEPETFIEPWGE